MPKITEDRRILTMVRDFLQVGIQGNPDAGDSATIVDWDRYDKIMLNINGYLNKTHRKASKKAR
jgi:hypothetical protein